MDLQNQQTENLFAFLKAMTVVILYVISQCPLLHINIEGAVFKPKIYF